MKAVAYEAVTNQIVAAMEKGIIPWKKSWGKSMPRNAVSNKVYKGINFFLLSMTYHTDQRWLTYNQASTLGGQVRKGEKSMPVVLWKWLKNEKDETFPIIRYYNVFNVSQIDGLKLSQVDEQEVQINCDAESIVSGYDGPKIEFRGCQPCYIPSLDSIRIPGIENFDTSDEYYSTMFHEMIHSTGHPDRLKRDLGNRFGSELYSIEELVAELGAAFLCNASGIDNTIENNAAYLQSWMKAFKSDPKMLVQAAGKAQKAANYVLGIKEHEEESTE